MERTIDKTNGAEPGEQPPSRSMIRTALPYPNGVEVLWTNREGAFIGSAIIRGISPQALQAMVRDLVPFIEEETRRMMFSAAAANQPGSKQ